MRHKKSDAAAQCSRFRLKKISRELMSQHRKNHAATHFQKFEVHDFFLSEFDYNFL